METDGIADDLRGGDERVDLLHPGEDKHHEADIRPRLQVERRAARLRMQISDDAGRDQAEDVSDVGDNPEDGHEDTDQQCVWEIKEKQRNTDKDTVDHPHDHLAAEERDKVSVDFLEGGNEFGLEAGCTQRDVFMPVLADRGGSP